jgi:GntR family transcriptional regulator/MocR family aminotransferase
MDDEGRVIYLGTFSKSFLPAARMSYIVMPDRLAKGFRERLTHYSQATSPILQIALRHFMKEGHYERHVRRMRKLYQSKHRTLLRAIHRYMGDKAEIIGQKAGLHLVLDVRNRRGDELAELALRVGVKIYLPNNHWMDPAHCPVSYVMLGFGGINEAGIEEGIRRLKEAWFDHIE